MTTNWWLQIIEHDYKLVTTNYWTWLQIGNKWLQTIEHDYKLAQIIEHDYRLVTSDFKLNMTSKQINWFWVTTNWTWPQIGKQLTTNW